MNSAFAKANLLDEIISNFAPVFVRKGLLLLAPKNFGTKVRPVSSKKSEKRHTNLGICDLETT